MAYQIM